MCPLRILMATLTLAATTAAATEATDVRVTTGLPQVSLLGSEAVAWRYLSMRAGTRLFSVEAKVPTCAGALQTLSSPPPVLSGSTRDGCAEPSGDFASGAASEQLKAKLRLPSAFAGGPDVDFTVRAWRSARRSEFGTSSRSGSSAELALTQPIGAANLFSGYSVPIAAGSTPNTWRTAFAGLEWQPVARHLVEFAVDQARDSRTGERDRQITLRYSYAGGRDARFGVYLTRLADDPVERWRSGLGLVLAF